MAISADCCSNRTAKSATMATTISRSYCRTPIMATNTRTISGRIAVVACCASDRIPKSVLPAATASVYVPPSNILSKEGRQTPDETCPEIRTIASTYLPSDSKLPYVQEFGGR